MARAAKKANGLSIRDVMETAYADMSYRVCDTLSSGSLEDVSGFWSSSLVISLLMGKFVSGMYVVSGPEQSAKSTLMATTIGDSIYAQTILHLHYDVERAARSSYMGRIVEYHADIDWEKLKGTSDGKGKQIIHPRYRWLTESSLEAVFYEMRAYLTSLPDKIYVNDEDSWYLVFDEPIKDGPYVSKEHKDMHARVAANLTLDTKRSSKQRKWYNIGNDASFQVFYALDSVKAMTLTSVEEHKKGFHQPGLVAKALAEELPYVKGLLNSKHAIAFFVNQMYVNPMAKYGDPMYETAGNALKLYSDIRCIMKPCKVQDGFDKSKKNSSICEEPSVIEKGGKDSYTFKSIKNIKGKFAPVPYLSSYIRIWSSGPGVQPGIDPVYDTLQFLQMLNLATMSPTSRKITLSKSPLLEGYSGEVYTFEDFKSEILAEVGLLGDDNSPGLRDVCKGLLEDGRAFSHIQGSYIDTSQDDDSADDD